MRCGSVHTHRHGRSRKRSDSRVFGNVGGFGKVQTYYGLFPPDLGEDNGEGKHQ